MLHVAFSFGLLAGSIALLRYRGVTLFSSRSKPWMIMALWLSLGYVWDAGGVLLGYWQYLPSSAVTGIWLGPVPIEGAIFYTVAPIIFLTIYRLVDD
jgi:lycopene cyclase domain-containing protein